MKFRFFLFYFFLFLGFGILLFRLFELTVIEGSHNRELSEGQRIKIRKITAPRGVIFDRQGKPLVRNIPIYKECPARKGQSLPENCQGLTREEALRLEAQGKDGDLVVKVGREYPYQEAMAHLLGYLGEATDKEVRSGKWEVGSLVGRTGIEEQYEDILRGVDGGELIEVDTYGVVVRKIGKQEPVAGRNITLSIDANLQQSVYEALKTTKGVYPEGSARGAVVAQDPQTGQVLALVSSPSFNPAKLTSEVLEDSRYPLFNRAIAGTYPPGSTFKIVTATAGLEEEKINGETKIEDPGEIVIGQYRYANWYFTQYGKTEGVINLVWAIKRSTDTFFYKVGELVGAKKLVAWGKAFGLGRISGIDLPGESAGFLPDPLSGDWFLGNTYHLSIGQGNLGLTPLQVNTMTGVIASGGKLCQPRIQQTTNNQQQSNCQEVGLKPETVRLITEGMREACFGGGTAFPLFNFKVPVACKTGTAEFGDPAGRTHAWLTAFAPADNPEIVVTALVEAGGEGSSVAAPVVREVLEEWFGR